MEEQKRKEIEEEKEFKRKVEERRKKRNMEKEQREKALNDENNKYALKQRQWEEERKKDELLYIKKIEENKLIERRKLEDLERNHQKNMQKLITICI